MSKEQIEEMAREMCHLSAECETCQICDERYHGDGNPVISNALRRKSQITATASKSG